MTDSYTSLAFNAPGTISVKFCTEVKGRRDCNPGVDFSIPGFGIGKMPIKGSRRDWRNIVWAYITTAYGHGLLSSDHSFHLYR